jgi:hypothetical protein
MVLRMGSHAKKPGMNIDGGSGSRFGDDLERRSLPAERRIWPWAD